MNAVALTVAQWAAQLRWDQVPAPVRDRLTLRIADGVGLIAAAWDTPPGRAVRDLAEAMSGPAPEPAAPLLFGGAPVTPAWGALAHGTLLHALDYDDTFPTSVVHPTSVLLPAALAAAGAAERGAGQRGGGVSGPVVLAAVAAADEFFARLGAAAGRGLHARGFQATSVFGPPAAALLVGTLHRRVPAVVAQAAGLAGSMSGGLLEFLSDGSWSKRLHPGWAAHGGVVADELAARGFPGPASIVEGRHGLFSAFLGQAAGPSLAATLTDGLGERWWSAEAQLKLYPCAHVLHPFIEAARRLRAHHRLDPSRITEIVCEVAPWYVPIVCEPVAEKQAPVTEYQARTSLPVAVALALLDPADVAVASFEPASTDRPALRELAARVRYVPDPALAEGFGARLTVRTPDGALTDPGGVEEDPAARELRRVREKFYAGVRGAGTAAESLWRAVRELDRSGVGQLRQYAAALASGWHERR